MQFVVIAHDYKDEKALERRLAVRDEHLRNAEKMFSNNKLIFASALLNDDGNMDGSVMVVDFPTEEDLRKDWLDSEAYVVGKVWEDITISKAKVAKH